MNKPQLVNVLIGKSIAETILVGAIAVVAFLNAFPPTFHGWGEAVVESRSIAGWAVNDADPWQHFGIDPPGIPCLEICNVKIHEFFASGRLDKLRITAPWGSLHTAYLDLDR